MRFLISKYLGQFHTYKFYGLDPCEMFPTNIVQNRSDTVNRRPMIVEIVDRSVQGEKVAGMAGNEISPPIYSLYVGKNVSA